MSINNRNTLAPGPTETGVVILLFSNAVGNRAIVERSLSPSGPWEEIADVPDVEASGTPFFDLLPLNSVTYYYRAKATQRGFEDSNFTTVVSAAPTLIPLIDWLNKPWLYDSSIPLQLSMEVVAETTGSIIVSASLNLDPVGLGIPVVSIDSFFGVPSVTASGSLWVIQRPISGSGRVTFRNDLAGRLGDTDSVDIGSFGQSILRTVVTPLGSTTSQQIVSVRVTDSSPQSGSYITLSTNLLGIPSISPTGSFMVSSSQARQFTIARPAYGAGIGRVTFIATASGSVTDTDAIDIAEQDIRTQPAAGATITLNSITSGSDGVTVTYSFPSSSTAQQVFVYSREADIDIPGTSVEFIANQVAGSPLYPNDGRSVITIPVLTPGNVLVATFVPFDALGRRGQVQSFKALSLVSALTPPDSFPSQSLGTVGTTFASASIEMPAANLPDNIRVYLDGSPFGSLITRTAAASTNQTVVVGGLTAETLYSLTFSGVNADGAESEIIATTLVFTTPNGGVLATPDVSFGTWEDLGAGEGLLYFNVQNGGDYPSGTTFEGDLEEYPGPTPIGSIAATTSTTLTFNYPGPGSVTGEAVFRARRTGFTVSADTDNVSWNNTGGEDI